MTTDRTVSEPCPATFGREATEHSWITVTRSTSRQTPYEMCSKCGKIARTALQPPLK